MMTSEPTEKTGITYGFVKKIMISAPSINVAGYILGFNTYEFPELTVAETLSISTTAARGRKGWSLTEVQSRFPRLVERNDHKIRFLSGGERQMVSVAAGLMSAPRLLILDEPTLGLSPKIRAELCAAILTVKETGLPIILIDQDVAFLEQIIDTLYLFDHGRISGRMSREEMPDHDGLMAILFGDQH